MNQINWKSAIKTSYSEVKLIMQNCDNHKQVQNVLGNRYLSHHEVCPITRKKPTVVFTKLDRWGLFNACAHCADNAPSSIGAALTELNQKRSHAR